MDRTKKLRRRNPLKDLNHVAASTIAPTNSSSSSRSIEAPRGCLRFLLSNSPSPSSNCPRHMPKSLSKTPKSASNARILSSSKSKPRTESIPKRAVVDKIHKPKKNAPCLYQWPSRGPHTTNPNSTSDKMSSKQKGCLTRGVNEADKDENSTPVSKLTCGSGLDFAFDNAVEESSNGSNSKTPPVQPSVSPEIQCGLSLMAKTPTCYGAGHVLSGVTDKRKCRARGVLTIRENHMLSFDKGKASDDDVESGDGFVDDARVSDVPLPTEASMHWLSTPQGEKDELQKEDSENPSDICNYSDKDINTSTNNGSIDKRITKSLLSPTALHEFQGFPGFLSDCMASCSSLSPAHPASPCKTQEEINYQYDHVEKNTPISLRTDSLGSGNVIQTPESDSISDRHVGLSFSNSVACKDQRFESELDSVAEVLQMTRFSPKDQISMWDPSGLCSQFDQLPACYNFIDLSQLQKTLERASWISGSTLENASQSQTRISWREGLVSRIFEMDELACCRCLSDEEKDANDCSDDQLKSNLSSGLNVDEEYNQILTADFGSPELSDHKSGADRKGKKKVLPERTIACAESISNDEGGLVASGDSDWTSFYKNQLFEV